MPVKKALHSNEIYQKIIFLLTSDSVEENRLIG